jgi:pilus assembly protein FimV
MQLSPGLKEEIKSVLGYMDQLLESLPEEKIEEFAKSEYFSIYKKLFEELGLVS